MTELETIRAALQAGLRTSDESTGALMLAGLVALGEIAEDLEPISPKSHREFQMIAMRQSGQTLQQIATFFKISRERVRQILEPLGIRKPEPPQQWPIRGFSTRMKQWLQSAGYRKCSSCQIWQTGITATNRRCSPCNCERRAEYYRTEHGRAYMSEYRKKHPEVQKRATKRHIEKHKSDPEWLEKRRAYHREYSRTYVRRKQQPEGRP